MMVRRPIATTFHSNLSLAAAACGFALLLSGCGVTGGFPGATSDGATLVIAGNVHGGQQPVTGGHVHVMQAASSAYGAASAALMTANGTTILSDSIGPYVATDSGGNFSITGDYTCTAGAQVYLLATQGNPGMTAGTNNMGIGIMAGLGACPGSHTLAGTVPFVIMNEVTTVATAYALAGFFTDSTHLSTDGSAGATIGINNAAANIAQISGISGGVALATTPNGQGTVPQAKLNLLGNILASCINSNGSTCSSLFSLTPNSSSVVPSETATAAINIAHNPGANVSALYNLVNATGPFQPTPSSMPGDYSITIHYTPSTPIFATSGSIAIDASGDVWGPGAGATSAIELSPLGALTQTITYSTGYSGNPLNVAVSPAGTIWVANQQLAYAQPTDTYFTPANDYGAGAVWAYKEIAVAFDTSNNAWVVNAYPASFGEVTSSGTAVAASDSGYAPPGFAGSSNYDVNAVAVDSANHVWGLCQHCNGGIVAAEITSNGTAISGTNGDTASSFEYPSGVAIDAGNNAWFSDSGTGQLTKYSSSSVLLSGSGYPGSNVGLLNGLAVDGASNVWVVAGSSGNGSILSFNNSGTETSPTYGYVAPNTSTYYGESIALDGSGNVWELDYEGGLHEVIGIAVPVVTPITPSALGVRP